MLTLYELTDLEKNSHLKIKKFYFVDFPWWICQNEGVVTVSVVTPYNR